MNSITITRIDNLLTQTFAEHIDMSDYADKPDGERKKAFLSRAIAALCVKHHTGLDPATAALSVTDEFHDNGLDAICFDQKTDNLILVQSKWSENGTKTIDAAAANAFATGVEDLLNARFERFSAKIQAKEPEIRAALMAPGVGILLITAHTGTQATAPFVTRKVDDLVAQLNEPVQIASAKHYNQGGIYGLLTAVTEAPKIKLTVSLQDWGVINTPYKAYYGRVHVSEIAKWWEEHGNSLFQKNIRLFNANSDVNEALHATLETDPENFWYFNNGVTLICDLADKSMVGSPGRAVGIFTCEGASVVNGAQTVGTIGRAALAATNSSPPDVFDVDAWVQVRIISLEKCPPELSRRITRAANLQNAVGNREFAGMDPIQHRLATEFTLDKRRYSYRQGEIDPKGDEGCDIAEATQALACNHSIAQTVQVKREIGAIWANTDAPPYTELFHPDLTSGKVWQLIVIMRAVDETLQTLKRSAHPRAEWVAVHMNRVVLHLVYQDPQIQPLKAEYSCQELAKTEAVKATQRAFERVAAYLEQHHKNDYLASLSKNLTKCEAMVAALLHPPKDPRPPTQEQPTLWESMPDESGSDPARPTERSMLRRMLNTPAAPKKK